MGCNGLKLIFMNKDTRGTIDFGDNRTRESLLTCLPVLLNLWELYIYGGSWSKIGSSCHSVNHFHIVWSTFTSIQIFSLFPPYDLSTTPAPVLLGAYFNTPSILFNTSDSVTVLWLAATLARTSTNERKWFLKKKKKSFKTKCNCRRL